MFYLRLTGAVLILSLSSAGGCYYKAVETRRSLPDLRWPQSPEIPRIRFVNSISKPEDLRISESAARRFLDFFTGRTAWSMVAPYGLEVDSEGRLYVVDTFLRKIHTYDTKRNKYYTFPGKKTKLYSPIDLAIDNKRGYIYVTDSSEAVVKIFKKKTAEYVGRIEGETIGRPAGIAVNEKTDELLVVDTVNSNILAFDLADHHLKKVLGSGGEAEGKFHYPTNISVSKDGRILISDSLNFRVQVFSPDGKFISAFGEAGDAPGYFSRPKGVASDSDGNTYVVDALFDNVQVFDKDGKLLMAFGWPGNDYGQFWLPTGIFIDGHDYIYVSDTYNKRVQVFQYLKGEGFSRGEEDER